MVSSLKLEFYFFSNLVLFGRVEILVSSNQERFVFLLGLTDIQLFLEIVCIICKLFLKFDPRALVFVGKSNLVKNNLTDRISAN